ncbi:unnamed protein product [Absidia cylindrospora]
MDFHALVRYQTFGREDHRAYKRWNRIEDIASSSKRTKNTFIDLYYKKRYSELDHHQQNTVCLGLNSILDLSDQSNYSGSQRTFFNCNDWEMLQRKYGSNFLWKKMDSNIDGIFEEIEKLAHDDPQASYSRCLGNQLKFALQPEECLFKVDGHLGDSTAPSCKTRPSGEHSVIGDKLDLHVSYKVGRGVCRICPICHHSHISFTRLSITTQQWYLYP